MCVWGGGGRGVLKFSQFKRPPCRPVDTSGLVGPDAAASLGLI